MSQIRTWFSSFGAAVGGCLVLAAVLGACKSGASRASAPEVAPEDRKPFGRVCDSSAECEFGACVQVSTTRWVCSGGCDPAVGALCPQAPNWACLTPNETDELVCACQSDLDYEVCDDGLDNDCDGLIDNCATCAGLLVPADSAEHCGGCGRRCLPGSVCLQGQCECPEGVAEGECLMDPFAPDCVIAADCDDGIACTEEICRAGRCASTVVPARCGQAEVCDLRRGGCVEAQPCARDADCLDDDPCTTREICDPATRVCLWLPLDGDRDGDPPRVCGGTDCDDSNPNIFTGAPDYCNGVDDSCNGAVDVPLVEGACGGNQACDAGRCVCTGELVACSAGGCVDTSSDPLNCGGCSNACPQGSTCSEGNCTCGDDLAVCRAGCTDVQDDLLNCGRCDLQCAVGSLCSKGLCTDLDECALETDTCIDERQDCLNVVGGYTCPCKSGFSGSQCVDINECLLTSNNNCATGACVNTVGSFDCKCPTGYAGDGLTCDDVNECDTNDCGANGSCVNTSGNFYCNCSLGYSDDGSGDCAVANACLAGILEPEQKWCLGACRTLATDSNHCGDCGVACGNGTCVDDSCTCAGGSGLSFCAVGGCVSFANDPAHCGDCDTECAVGGSCVSGTCRCPSGQEPCGGVCTELGTNLDCLSCDDFCPSGGSCGAGLNGACGCPAGQFDCSGTCVDRQTDELNCGECGTTCNQGASCESGTCACPVGVTDICDATCVDLQTEELYCGDCATACAQGATCTAGSCACDGAGEAVCSDVCVAFETDESNCGGCGTPCNVLCQASFCAVAVEVATSDSATCALLSDDTVWCWGMNSYGILGDGSTSTFGQHVPRQVTGLLDIARIAMGNNHACAISSTGTLSCWGFNTSNAFYSTTAAHQQTAVEVRTGVDDVALGSHHTCAVLTDGTIECTGSDANGQHGDGVSVTPSGTWSGPSGLSNVDKLVSGSNHVCALKGGKVHCWGSNTDGQLGSGNLTQEVDDFSPGEVTGVSGVDDISAGANHTCAVFDGQVSCWGLNTWMQVGVASTADVVFSRELAAVNNAISVHAGGSHTCAKLDTGSIVCWGYRQDGRLGDGYSSGTTNVPQAMANSTDINALSLGGAHTCGIDSLGDVHCWGDGNSTSANGRTSDANVITEVVSWSQVTP